MKLQVFHVPNNTEGRQFIEQMRQYLEDDYQTRVRGRSANPYKIQREYERRNTFITIEHAKSIAKHMGYIGATPHFAANYFGVYIKPSQTIIGDIAKKNRILRKIQENLEERDNISFYEHLILQDIRSVL